MKNEFRKLPKNVKMYIIFAVIDLYSMGSNTDTKIRRLRDINK